MLMGAVWRFLKKSSGFQLVPVMVDDNIALLSTLYTCMQVSVLSGYPAANLLYYMYITSLLDSTSQQRFRVHTCHV